MAATTSVNAKCSESLQNDVSVAVVQVCQQLLTFTESVKITGSIAFSIDDHEEIHVTLSETVTKPPLSSKTRQSAVKNELASKEQDGRSGADSKDVPVKRRRGRPRKAKRSAVADLPSADDMDTKNELLDDSTNMASVTAVELTNLADVADPSLVSLMKEDQTADSQQDVVDSGDLSGSADQEDTHADEKKRFSCDRCDFATDHSGHYKRHVARRHGGDEARPEECSECGKRFFAADELKRHIKKVHEAAVMQCPCCDVQLKAAGKLKKHLREAHGVRQKMLSCPSCTLRFVTEDLLKRHIEEKHCNNCTICEEKFTDSRALRMHTETVHADTVLTCTVCSRQCSTRGALRRHVACHAGVFRPRVACDQCEKSFTSSSTLYHHKRAIHGTEKPYVCVECGERFNFNHSLKLHILKHAGQRPHQCPTCNKSYLTASHLKYHVDAIHSATKRFVCNVCGKAFPYETSFKLHRMLHAGDRPFTCTSCGKSFVTRGALREHEEAHVGDGEGQRRYRCEVCGRFYRTPALLRAHARRHTADATRHVCEVCGRTFMYRSNLEAHATVHTGERAFSCKICAKTFKTPATLYTHRITHRTDIVPSHVCTSCGKAFKTKERLRAHEARHSGVKPFRCRACGGAFPDRGGLAKHAKTVHAARPRFACPACGKSANRLDNLRVHMRTHGDANLLSLTASDLMAGGAGAGVPYAIAEAAKQTFTVHSAVETNVPATTFTVAVSATADFQQPSGFSFLPLTDVPCPPPAAAAASTVTSEKLDLRPFGQLPRYNATEFLTDNSAYIRHCLSFMSPTEHGLVGVTPNFTVSQPDQSQSLPNVTFMQ